MLKPVFSRRSGSVPTMVGMARPFLLWLWTALGVAALTGGPVRASDREEVDRARAAVQAGELLPLDQVLQRVQRSVPGQVLEVELEREGGRWVYEIHLLQAGGRLLKLQVDGRTAAVIRQRGRAAAHAASR
jgi:uncharacterized iron-regulated membrane protein